MRQLRKSQNWSQDESRVIHVHYLLRIKVSPTVVTTPPTLHFIPSLARGKYINLHRVRHGKMR